MIHNVAPSDALSVGIVMSDLFISATAALLIVLALAQPYKPKEVPIQADLVAYCPPLDTPRPEYRILIHSANEPEAAVSLHKSEELGGLPSGLLLEPRLFYSIALVEKKGHPLTPTCLKWVQQNLINPWNRSLQEKPPVQEGSRAVFSATASLADAESEAKNE